MVPLPLDHVAHNLLNNHYDITRDTLREVHVVHSIDPYSKFKGYMMVPIYTEPHPLTQLNNPTTFPVDQMQEEVYLQTFVFMGIAYWFGYGRRSNTAVIDYY